MGLLNLLQQRGSHTEDSQFSSVLRTCKWIESEATDILYGENSFIVRADSVANVFPSGHPRLLLLSSRYVWTRYCERMPGANTQTRDTLPSTAVADSDPLSCSSRKLTDYELNDVFDYTRQSKTHLRDLLGPGDCLEAALTMFFGEIGPRNSSRLRTLIIMDEYWGDLYCERRLLIADILPVVAPHLLSLTLRLIEKTDKGTQKETLAKSNWNRTIEFISNALGETVTNMKQLKTLELRFARDGNDKDTAPGERTWGVSEQWSKFVQDRSKALTEAV